MQNVTRMPLPAPEMTTIDQKAQALAEISHVYAALEESTRITEEQARTILRQQDRIDMLETELREQRQRAQVCERKLIRLAANQRNIHRISQDGDEIMRSVQEWQESEAAPGNDADCGQILQRVASDETVTTEPPPNSL